MDFLRRPVFVFDLFHTLSSLYHSGVGGPDTHELLGVDRDRYLRGLFERSEQRLRGRIRSDVAIIRDIAVGCGVTIGEKRLAEIAKLRRRRFAESLRRIAPPTLDALDALTRTGKRLALISNADALEAAGWSRSPLADRFETAIFSCDVGLRKPEEEIYLLCAQRMGVSAGDCVFVGDGGSNELAGARAVGMAAVCTTELTADLWPEKTRERRREADMTVDSLYELAIRTAEAARTS